jgi:hypothetical protein
VGKKSGKPGADPGEGGRPRRTDLNIEVMQRAASIGCTVDEIAALIGIPKRTFYDHLERDPELQKMLDEAREQGKGTLRRLQWQRASGGSDTMLIWLGKQMLKQRDKHEITGEDGNAIKTEVVYSWDKPPPE